MGSVQHRSFAADLVESSTEISVVLRGDIDLASETALREALDRAVQSRVPAIHIDLSGVTFLDSTGLGALVSAKRKSRHAGASFFITCPNESILKVFEITGLVELLGVNEARPGLEASGILAPC